METYSCLQHYWWFLISLLGGILVFLLFVQGGNSLIFQLGRNNDERSLFINATGRKWEFTFTTLVTFGGAFFASFPLFYSTSFGGAYWAWMIILFTFVLQAVSYEFQANLGNLLGKKTYQFFLVLNGVVGPLLLGAAVATFFTGSNFFVDKGNMSNLTMPVISRWANSWHGIDILFNIWNWVLGIAVYCLSRILGSLYFINRIKESELVARCRKQLIWDTVLFLFFFLAFLFYVLTSNGYAVNPDTKEVYMEPYKYLTNFLQMPAVLITFLVGVVLVLVGIARGIFSRTARQGIWFAGIGTVLTVMALFLCVGYNHTSFYPSAVDLQSSLTIENSSSSPFTLQVMSYVSILIPFVLAYIIYAWRALEKKQISHEEIKNDDHAY